MASMVPLSTTESKDWSSNSGMFVQFITFPASVKKKTKTVNYYYYYFQWDHDKWVLLFGGEHWKQTKNSLHCMSGCLLLIWSITTGDMSIFIMECAEYPSLTICSDNPRIIHKKKGWMLKRKSKERFRLGEEDSTRVAAPNYKQLWSLGDYFVYNVFDGIISLVPIKLLFILLVALIPVLWREWEIDQLKGGLIKSATKLFYYLSALAICWGHFTLIGRKTRYVPKKTRVLCWNLTDSDGNSPLISGRVAVAWWLWWVEKKRRQTQATCLEVRVFPGVKALP